MTTKIPQSPDVPQSQQPAAEFNAKTDAWLRYIADQLVPGLNEFVGQLNNYSTTSTSIDAIAMAIGNIAITVETGKGFQPGMDVKLVSLADTDKWMAGTVTTYNPATGAMEVNVSYNAGIGTFSGWRIFMAAATTAPGFDDAMAEIQVAADRVDAAADRAEQARDAAGLAALIYPDTATALAGDTEAGWPAVPVGHYFTVISPTAAGFVDIYKNNAGVAEYINTFPSSSALNSFIVEVNNRIDDLGIVAQIESTQYALAVTDDQGNSALTVKQDGTVLVSEVETSSLKTGEIDNPEYALAFADEQDNVVFGIKQDGVLKVKGLDVVDAEIVTSDSEMYVLAFVDELNNVVFGITAAGEIFYNGQGRSVEPGPEPEPEPTQNGLHSLSNHKTDYMHIFTYGQSLAVGSQATPPISTTQPYENVTFLSGVLTKTGSNVNYTGFKPLIEASSETPASGAINGFVARRIAAGDSASDWVMMGTAPGQGGTSIENLSRGSTTWGLMMAQVSAAKSVANTLGKSYAVWAMTWTQGEANHATGNTTASYYAALIKMKEEFAEDVAAITGQDFKPPLICYQCAAHRRYQRNLAWVALAQWAASRNDPDIIMACAMYALPYAPDNLHLTANSSQQLGKYYGRALDSVYEHMISGTPIWRPLEPVSVLWQGRIIDIKFHVPYGQLVFDTTIVTAAPNMGFDVWDGAEPLTEMITAVTIVGPDRVRIVLANDPPVEADLTYARGRPGDANTAGPIDGPRGNLRDQHGDVDHYEDSTGATRYLHNWCVIWQFSKTNGFPEVI